MAEASGILSSFEALTPLIREHQAAAEANGRLSSEVVSALLDAGIARLFLAKALGGLEADPVTCAAVTETLSRADSAAGWFVMVANSARLIASTWPDALAEEIFAHDPNTLISASGNTPLTGVASDGGFRLKGVNRFVSGAHDAHWFMSPFSVGDTRYMGLLPMQECEILKTWSVLGMRGTDSQDVAVADLWIPARHAVPIDQPAPLNRFHQGPLYRCPGRVLFATYVPITLVLAEQALAELAQLAQSKTPAGEPHKLRDRSIAQIKYGKGLAAYRSARLYFLDALAAAYARAQRGEEAGHADRADLYLAGTHAVQASAKVVQWVADAAGTTVIYQDHPLARITRDMETLRHHGYANESRYGSVTQLLWGAGLDYPLLLR